MPIVKRVSPIALWSVVCIALTLVFFVTIVHAETLQNESMNDVHNELLETAAGIDGEIESANSLLTMLQGSLDPNIKLDDRFKRLIDSLRKRLDVLEDHEKLMMNVKRTKAATRALLQFYEDMPDDYANRQQTVEKLKGQLAEFDNLRHQLVENKKALGKIIRSFSTLRLEDIRQKNIQMIDVAQEKLRSVIAGLQKLHNQIDKAKENVSTMQMGNSVPN